MPSQSIIRYWTVSVLECCCATTHLQAIKPILFVLRFQVTVCARNSPSRTLEFSVTSQNSYNGHKAIMLPLLAFEVATAFPFFSEFEIMSKVRSRMSKRV
jgi:hypothetical protein